MSDAGALQRRIAVGLAVAALAVATVAVVVVVRRGAHTASAAALAERHVAAADVTRLEQDAVEATPGGVRVKDRELAKALGLGGDDVIAAIAGRPTARALDVHVALFNLGMMNAASIDVDLVHGKELSIVRWRIDGDLHAARYSTDALRPWVTTAQPAVTPPLVPVPSGDPLIDSIVKVDDTHYVIPKDTVDKILANPMAIAKGARVVPAVKNGKANGFKLYAIRPDSAYAHLGLMNGDTLQAVNGFDLTTPDKALEVYTKLRDATSLELSIERRGQPVTLTITIK